MILALQLTYALIALAHNGLSLRRVQGGQRPLTSNDPRHGFVVMSVYTLCLGTAFLPWPWVYRGLMGMAVVVLGIVGIVRHLRHPEAFSTRLALVSAVSINAVGLLLNAMAAAGIGAD